MADDTQAQDTGDRPSWTPEDAAPHFAAWLFPEESDRNASDDDAPAADPDAEQSAEDAEQPETTAEDEPPEDTEQADQSDETTEADDEPSQPRKIPITLEDGTTEEVPEDELVETYRRKKAQIADYTRKTQAAAEHEKRVQEREAQVTADAERYAEALKQLEDALKVEEPDWDAVQREHPDQFLTLFANWQRQERQREIVKREREATEAKVAEERKQHFARALADERAKLFQAIPEWTDEATLTADRERMVAYAKERGFTDADIAGIVDHRVIQLWRDATLWRQAVQQKPTVEPKKAAPKKPAAPGGGSSTARKQPTEAERAANRLKRTGRVEDAAKVFEQFV